MWTSETDCRRRRGEGSDRRGSVKPLPTWIDVGGGTAEEGVACKENTDGRAVRLPATVAPESGKATHARTTGRLPSGAS